MGCNRRRPCEWIRVVIIAINIIVVLAGFAISALGIYLRVGNVRETFWTHIVGNAFIAYGTIAVGALMVTVGFCGVLGSIYRNRCMLSTYITFVVLFVMAQIALVIFVIVENSNMQKYFETGWHGLNNETKFLLQERLQCCGFSNVSEWGNEFPASCYNSIISTNTSTAGTTDVRSRLWNDNCSDDISKFISDNMVYAICVVGGLFLLELLQMVLACLMVRRINRRRANGMDYDDSVDSEAAFEEFMNKKIHRETYCE